MCVEYNANVTLSFVVYFMVLLVALGYTASDGRVSLMCPIPCIKLQYTVHQRMLFGKMYFITY